MALTIDHRLLASHMPPKEKLRAIMTSLKHQRESFLKNEHFPHLCAAMMTLNPPRTMQITSNRFSTGGTNIGVVDKIIPLEWHPDGDIQKQPLFRLSEWSFGVRYMEPNMYDVVLREI